MPGRQAVGQDELRQMVRCVQLYYRAQRHQNEIARELGMSSSKVSRLLKRAFAEGVVRVEIDRLGELENQVVPEPEAKP